MLSLVSSARESDIEQHLQAENILICESFALDHQKFSHYGVFQLVNLQSLRKEGTEQFNKLNEEGFGASLNGDLFLTTHVTYFRDCLIKRQRAPLVPLAADLVPI